MFVRAKLLGSFLALALGSLPAAAGAGESLDELPRSKRATGDDAAELAPVGLTDARSLTKHHWAVSYRYAWIHADDVLDKDQHESTDEVLEQFQRTPTKRNLQVHLVGISYAPFSRLTVSAKLPILVQKTHSIAAGPPRESFATSSGGFGDLELRGLFPFMRNRNQSLQLELGLTVPTGSVSEMGRGPEGVSELLTLPQQTGSGTVDLLSGFVYRGRWQTVSWGFVGRGRFRMYDNHKDYRLGNQYLLSTWFSQSWTEWMSTSLRLSWNRREAGQPRSSATVDPEYDPKRLAGEFLEIGPGVNFKMPILGRPRLGVEMTWPFYQTVQGPQLEHDWQLTSGVQWVF